MAVFIGVIGFLGCLVSIGLLLFRAIAKKGLAYKQIGLIFLISFILFIIGAALTPSSTTTTQTSNKQSVATSQKKAETIVNEQPTKKTQNKKSNANNVTSSNTTSKNNTTNEVKNSPTLGISIEEFKKRFNKAAEKLNTDFYISDVQIIKGSAKDTFQYTFTNNLALVGTLNKQNKQIDSITIIGTGDGTLKSGTDILLSMGVLIMAMNPELSANERGNILRELGLLGDNTDIWNLNKSTIRNGKKYFLMTSKELGIWFGVEPATNE